MKASSISALQRHQALLRDCRRCVQMIPPVITGHPAHSRIIQIGQAPGIHEGRVGKPFGWTAGKTLFQWYQGIGVEEESFRQKVYMAAVCRCFPGKHPKHGDRVPDKTEISACRPWLEKEFELLQPKLIIPVGKLAMDELMRAQIPYKKLVEVIGQQHRVQIFGHDVDIIPLPHPSGASTWHRMEPGKTLLQAALNRIAAHPVWQTAFDPTRGIQTPSLGARE